jgi:hypothetical protein
MRLYADEGMKYPMLLATQRYILLGKDHETSLSVLVIIEAFYFCVCKIFQTKASQKSNAPLGIV